MNLEAHNLEFKNLSDNPALLKYNIFFNLFYERDMPN